MQTLPRQQVVEVADGVTAVLNGQGEAGVANAVVIVESGDAVVVDSMLLPEMAAALLEVARSHGARARTVINTHFHIDHVGGNSAFPDAAVVAHPACAAAVERMIQEPPPFERIIPRYAGRLRAEALRPPEPFDGRPPGLPREARALVFNQAHTMSDLAVWLPTSRTLVAGDLCFKGVAPLAIHGSITGWVAALDELIALRPAVVVPGHGPLATAEDLRALRQHFQALLAVAQAAHETGMTAAEAARLLAPSPVSEWLESDRVLLNLQTAIRDVAATPL